jgi:peptidoglycan-associated lipoprotein
METSQDMSAAADFEKNVGDRVFFSFDSSELSSESKAQLDKQSKWLSDHASLKAVVEGHCDERGTREYNLALGERRADAAMRYLVSHGVQADRLETISYGKERPAAVGEGIDHLNRRAVIVIK